MVNSEVERRMALQSKEPTIKIHTQLFASKIQRRIIDSDAESYYNEQVSPKIKNQILNTSMESSISSSNQFTLKDMQRDVERDILNTLNFGNKKQIIKHVKGVGQKRADLLINYRELNGEFLEFGDLKKVGLSETQLASILKSNLKLE